MDSLLEKKVLTKIKTVWMKLKNPNLKTRATFISTQKELDGWKGRRAQQGGKMDPGDLRNVVNGERNKREGFDGRDRGRRNDSKDRGMGMGRDRGSSRDGGSSRDRPGFGSG